MITITVVSFIDGPLGGTLQAHLDELGGTIGRADTNQLVLPDPERTISRVAAQVVFRNGGFAVVDRGCNPIVVNGRAQIDEQKDAIGHIFVVFVILAEQLNDNQNLDIYKVDFYSYSSEYNLKQQLINSYNSGLVEVLFNLAIRLDLDLVECANLAWNEIKYRKGVTVNGTFIKRSVKPTDADRLGGM